VVAGQATVGLDSSVITLERERISAGRPGRATTRPSHSLAPAAACVAYPVTLTSWAISFGPVSDCSLTMPMPGP
jgi:hypothetical protein